MVQFDVHVESSAIPRVTWSPNIVQVACMASQERDSIHRPISWCCSTTAQGGQHNDILHGSQGKGGFSASGTGRGCCAACCSAQGPCMAARPHGGNCHRAEQVGPEGALRLSNLSQCVSTCVAQGLVIHRSRGSAHVFASHEDSGLCMHPRSAGLSSSGSQNPPSRSLVPREQWMGSQESGASGVRPVVVDPYLACHLRPHQVLQKGHATRACRGLTELTRYGQTSSVHDS